MNAPTLKGVKDLTPEEALEEIRRQPHWPLCICDQCMAMERKLRYTRKQLLSRTRKMRRA